MPSRGMMEKDCSIPLLMEASWDLQEDDCLPVKMRIVEDAATSGAALADSIRDISTWRTTVARMSAANAAAADFLDGSLIRLHGGPGSRYVCQNETPCPNEHASDHVPLKHVF